MATITLPGYLTGPVTEMLEQVAARLVQDGALALRDMEPREATMFSAIFAPPPDAPTPAEAYEALEGRWIDVTRTRQMLVHGSCSMTEATLADWFRDECRSSLAAIRAEIEAA